MGISKHLRLGLWLFQLLISASFGNTQQCYPAIFNFGDSTSDTGGIHGSFPFYTPAEFLPYGMSFNVTLTKPRARYSDKYLLIDYIVMAFGLNLLDPYLNALIADYSQGVNFATAGATVLPVTYLTPFSLGVQTNQYFLFRSEVLSMLSQSSATASGSPVPRLFPEPLSRIPAADHFSKGLYTIAIGGNDFTYGYVNGQSIAQVEATLPSVIAGIGTAITNLYTAGGARNFLVWDIEPQGCLPYTLTLVPHKSSDLDELGCLPAYNGIAQFFNNLLSIELQNLRGTLAEANIYLLSTYDLKIDMLKNASANGFLYTNIACCGVPSAYNLDLRVNCGRTQVIDNVTIASKTCGNPSEYLIWDSVHNTDAANTYIANQVFSGKYITPQIPSFTLNCNLSPI